MPFPNENFNRTIIAIAHEHYESCTIQSSKNRKRLSIWAKK